LNLTIFSIATNFDFEKTTRRSSSDPCCQFHIKSTKQQKTCKSHIL
jgi:hypothetical protein